MKFNYLISILFHVLLGVIVFFVKPFSILYFLAIIFFGIYRIYNSDQERIVFSVLSSAAYIVGAEVFLRMTKGNIGYESVKYVVTIFMFFGLLIDKGFTIENIAFVGAAYVVISLALLIIIRKSIEPVRLPN